MNIFYLDNDPKIAAQYHCDKHVVKMILETAQLLCSAFHLQNVEAPYRKTHVNHPSSVWARESSANFDWLLKLGFHLCNEYTSRYNKEHKTLAVLYWCLVNKNLLSFKSDSFTEPTLAMPDEYKSDDHIISYRNYYIHEKASIAVWKNSPTPNWFSYEQ